ncbi:Protein of unknown function [Gryllus bimaculatus]|nr:Protein of unknown function [Gryllus bimaculatus]
MEDGASEMVMGGVVWCGLWWCLGGGGVGVWWGVWVGYGEVGEVDYLNDRRGVGVRSRSTVDSGCLSELAVALMGVVETERTWRLATETRSCVLTARAYRQGSWSKRVLPARRSPTRWGRVAYALGLSAQRLHLRRVLLRAPARGPERRRVDQNGGLGRWRAPAAHQSERKSRVRERRGWGNRRERPSVADNIGGVCESCIHGDWTEDEIDLEGLKVERTPAKRLSHACILPAHLVASCARLPARIDAAISPSRRRRIQRCFNEPKAFYGDSDHQPGEEPQRLNDSQDSS